MVKITSVQEERKRLLHRRRVIAVTFACAAFATIAAGGSMLYRQIQATDAADATRDQVDAQYSAILSALETAIASTERPVKYVMLGEVNRAIDDADVFVATGTLLGKAHPFAIGRWPFVAHMARRCEDALEVCWRVDALRADGRLIYTDPPRAAPQRREEPPATLSPPTAAAPAEPPPLAWPVEWSIRR